jgi:hypothetical protein
MGGKERCEQMKKSASEVAEFMGSGQLFELSPAQVESFKALCEIAQSVIVGVDEQALRDAARKGMKREAVKSVIAECAEGIRFLRTLRPGDVVIRRMEKS